MIGRSESVHRRRRKFNVFLSKMLSKLVLFISLLTVLQVESAKILGYFQYPSYSHQIVYQKIWVELARRGHDVTVFTPNPTKLKMRNLKEIDLSDSYNVLDQHHELISDYDEDIDAVEDTIKLTKLFKYVLEHQLTHPEVHKLIYNNTQKYDLLLVEYLYPIMFALKDVLNCPMVGILTLEPVLLTHDYLRNPTHPIATPDVLLPIYKDLTFWERLWSYFHSTYLRISVAARVGLALRRDLREIFNTTKTTLQLGSEASLVFVNKPVLSLPRPTTPQIIHFSGLHLKQKSEKSQLPEDIQELLDSSENGVIYFSLGSNIKSNKLSEKTKNNILAAFAQLPYTVLWKFENDSLAHRPPNVHIHKWYPQQDILAHPNVKLFISQCGVQSLEESIHYGVPMIAIPFYADQFHNAKMITYHKVGVEVDFKTLTTETLKAGIQEVIGNPIYKKKVEKISKISRDKPTDDLSKIMWYIDYVIRHNGAEHFRNSALDIPLYQYLMLDIYAFLIIATYLSYHLTRKSVKLLSGLASRNKKEKSD